MKQVNSQVRHDTVQYVVKYCRNYRKVSECDFKTLKIFTFLLKVLENLFIHQISTAGFHVVLLIYVVLRLTLLNMRCVAVCIYPECIKAYAISVYKL